jgi:CTP synthase
MKTKPSQQSVGILRSIGIFPDMLICRCERHMSDEHRDKLALFCNVDRSLVIEEKDVANSIYEVPLELAKQDMDVYILELLRCHVGRLDMHDWSRMVNTLIHPQKGEVEIAVVGKYITLQDSYKSIYEALTHGGIFNDVRVKVRQVESEEIEKSGAEALLAGVDGILVPGGFGDRGIDGKIEAVRYARENNIPYFGICLGMQCAVMEFARNVCGIEDAYSSEFRDTKNPVIHLMESQRKIYKKGGTMRLGSYPCKLTEGTEAAAAYKAGKIDERHRHRYEFNNDYRDVMQKNGLVLSGLSPDGELVEIVEYPAHPWFVACQFHPEFQSTPMNPHPLFSNFIGAAMKRESDDAKTAAEEK